MDSTKPTACTRTTYFIRLGSRTYQVAATSREHAEMRAAEYARGARHA